MTVQSQRIGLLGKTPRQAEFIRLNAATPLALQLYNWMQEGVERAGRARVDLPSEPVNFVFTVPGQKQALVGLMAPSVDSVGRAFPLAIFTEVASAATAPRYALTPEAFQPFLRAAATLAAAARELEVPQLLERAAVLPLPGPGDFSVAQRLRDATLAEHRTHDLLNPVVEGAPEGGRYYALHTFLTACVGERGREQSAAGVALDCPLSTRVGPVAWLELSSRLLRWPHQPPAFFWSEGERPRLLLSLGAATPALFLALAQPSRPGAQVWPLRTERPAAIDNARKGLKAAARQVIDAPSTTLEQLLRALAP
ncbi:type VI secretion system-associated protein TagF [Pyxidicoccus parkwayensis]|uniref:Type VI secretion system-associated protein TagF n=1 Tax=Pyxidicoccus parkwayensis TaxID=2813578 RepID=A0ABX7P2Z7_9BACT|nr:type VI secretion system-associated protein TagF [Pyxidicoccus parkwaysis]QSQ24825.1 type VI secretion system-associated protein TagF [Pyxidicoccus parkwaysis]